MFILCYNLTYFEKNYCYEILRIISKALQILFFSKYRGCYQKRNVYVLCTRWVFPTSEMGGGAVGQIIRPASGRLSVRIPEATDISRKNRQWQLHCQTLRKRRECHVTSEMIIIKSRSVSLKMLPLKETSLLNGHECRVQVKNLQPFIGNGYVSK